MRCGSSFRPLTSYEPAPICIRDGRKEDAVDTRLALPIPPIRAYTARMKAKRRYKERLKLRRAWTRDVDLRLTPPRGAPATPPATPECNKPALKLRSDSRVPPPGTVLTRSYKGRTLRVQVLAHGFLYAGHTYPSLSAVAKAVTGSHCNGYLFFRLTV